MRKELFVNLEVFDNLNKIIVKSLLIISVRNLSFINLIVISINMSSNYSMLHHSFISPMRPINMTTAAVPINDRRDLSNSPYLQKKRNDVIISIVFYIIVI